MTTPNELPDSLKVLGLYWINKSLFNGYGFHLFNGGFEFL